MVEVSASLCLSFFWISVLNVVLRFNCDVLETLETAIVLVMAIAQAAFASLRMYAIWGSSRAMGLSTLVLHCQPIVLYIVSIRSFRSSFVCQRLMRWLTTRRSLCSGRGVSLLQAVVSGTGIPHAASPLSRITASTSTSPCFSFRCGCSPP